MTNDAEYEPSQGEQTWDTVQFDGGPVQRVPCLTVLLHPELSRVGERTMLYDFSTSDPVGLSRVYPIFHTPTGGPGRPLLDRFPSRRGPVLRRAGDGFVQDASTAKSRVKVDGLRLRGVRAIHAEELMGGVLIELSGRVALLLHTRALGLAPAPDLGLVGDSEVMIEVLDDVLRVAQLDVPVLLRGETGTGKELVASAIHRRGGRRDKPLVSLNMASIPASPAVSGLLGHGRGAFRGAVSDQAGHFVRANGGTLFLDEVGDTTPDVQTMLLRVLETQELTPLGGGAPVPVDVRLIAATDAPLEVMSTDGRFRAPLLHRLSGFTIRIPLLRSRVDDIGRLFADFVREAALETGQMAVLEAAPGEATPWFPSRIMRALVTHPWGGNVRELRNVARQLVIRGAGRLQMALRRELAGFEHSPPSGSGHGTNPGDEVTDGHVLRTLSQKAWRVWPAAKALSMVKSTLYRRMERSGLRKAYDLSAQELRDGREATGGKLREMSALLRVSDRGLTLRSRDLGVEI